MGIIRKSDTGQFRAEAVKLAESTGITTSISGWRKESHKAPSGIKASKDIASLEQENLKLKKELRYAYEVNEVLKKSRGIFVKEKTSSR